MWNSQTVYAIYGLCLFKTCFSQEYERAKCPQMEGKCDIDYQYRNMDGACNNIDNPKWGMAVTEYRRLLPNRFSDNVHAFPKAASGNDLPPARKVSIVMDPPDNDTDSKYTLGLMEFGQVFTHDLTRLGLFPDIEIQQPVECCKTPEFSLMGTRGKDFDEDVCAPIVAAPNDPVYSKAKLTCGDFPRSVTTKDLDCKRTSKVAEPLTIVTGYADLSNIYGSHTTVARTLRKFSDGLLKTVRRQGQDWPIQEEALCPQQPQSAPCYRMGDNRVEQNPQLASLHIAYYRYHNVIARKLGELNPNWDDEKLYQEARRINIARYQHICYNEYIPKLIGEKYTDKHKLRHCGSTQCIDDYDKSVDASMLVEFSSCAFRAPHTTIAGTILLINENRKTIGDLRLSDTIDKPSVLEYTNATQGNGELNYDNIIRGMSYQPQDKSDTFNVETKNFIFKGRGTYGLDLRSSDIQRDRDHGVGFYVKARKYCKLSVPKTFDDLLDIMPRKKVQKLKSLYEKVEDIDLSVGGLAEPIVPGARVGETNQCLLRIQFERTRYGDRFFYENCEKHSFSKDQLAEIRKATFACLLCDTSYGVEKMQPSAFDQLGRDNQLKSCKQLCDLNLEAWKEKKKSCHHKKPTRGCCYWR